MKSVPPVIKIPRDCFDSFDPVTKAVFSLMEEEGRIEIQNNVEASR
jgi:hypothetical protein